MIFLISNWNKTVNSPNKWTSKTLEETTNVSYWMKIKTQTCRTVNEPQRGKFIKLNAYNRKAQKEFQNSRFNSKKCGKEKKNKQEEWNNKEMVAEITKM